jgi:hypothetical protein
MKIKNKWVVQLKQLQQIHENTLNKIIKDLQLLQEHKFNSSSTRVQHKNQFKFFKRLKFNKKKIINQ